jgi:hypothetical protein
MSAKTAAPWEIDYAIPTDEPKVYPEVMKAQSERIALMLKEHVLIYKTYAGAETLKSGELAEQTKAGETFTLPLAATANQIISVFCAATSCKITTSGGATINGDFVSAEATITLTKFQHIVVQSTGANWLIIAGEPKLETKYVEKTWTKAEAEAGVEPSANRRSAVVFVTVPEALEIGGVAGIYNEKLTPYYLNPGQKWKATNVLKTWTILF